MSVQVINKIRNPKTWTWMDIWSAEATDGNNYTITPSNHWKIPVNRIESSIDTSQSTESTTHNVTIANPVGDHIAITNSNGTIKEGAEIKSTGDENTL